MIYADGQVLQQRGGLGIILEYLLTSISMFILEVSYCLPVHFNLYFYLLNL